MPVAVIMPPISICVIASNVSLSDETWNNAIHLLKLKMIGISRMPDATAEAFLIA
jgi:hypothetical protein